MRAMSTACAASKIERISGIAQQAPPLALDLAQREEVLDRQGVGAARAGRYLAAIIPTSVLGKRSTSLSVLSPDRG